MPEEIDKVGLVQALHAGHRHPGLLLRPAESVAARDQRKYKRSCSGNICLKALIYQATRKKCLMRLTDNSMSGRGRRWATGHWQRCSMSVLHRPVESAAKSGHYIKLPMPDMFQLYSNALTNLLQEAIRCSPAVWDSGRLNIKCDGNRIDYRLKNENSDEKAVISAEFAQLCEQYWTVFADHGDPWSEANADFWKEKGEWKFKVEFVRPAAQVTRSKSRWKFWQ